MDCSSPGSSVHGILQTRILEWVSISSFRGYSWPRDRTRIYPALQMGSLPTEPPGNPGGHSIHIYCSISEVCCLALSRVKYKSIGETNRNFLWVFFFFSFTVLLRMVLPTLLDLGPVLQTGFPGISLPYNPGGPRNDVRGPRSYGFRGTSKCVQVRNSVCSSQFKSVQEGCLTSHKFPQGPDPGFSSQRAWRPKQCDKRMHTLPHPHPSPACTQASRNSRPVCTLVSSEQQAVFLGPAVTHPRTPDAAWGRSFEPDPAMTLCQEGTQGLWGSQVSQVSLISRLPGIAKKFLELRGNWPNFPSSWGCSFLSFSLGNKYQIKYYFLLLILCQTAVYISSDLFSKSL